MFLEDETECVWIWGEKSGVCGRELGGVEKRETVIGWEKIYNNKREKKI